MAIDWSKCPDAESIPGKMSGAWCLKGTRIRCEDITGQFNAGCSAEEIAGPDIYPEIPLEVVKRILAFAGVPIYLSRIPAMVPAGLVVVHNNVRPTRRLSQRGFRAWLAWPSAALELCGCTWASELPEHYRVR